MCSTLMAWISFGGGVTEGTVDFINHKGRWFSVVYGKMRTSFFFSEIGKKVFHDRNLVK